MNNKLMTEKNTTNITQKYKCISSKNFLQFNNFFIFVPSFTKEIMDTLLYT
jgi:hypothetical protein